MVETHLLTLPFCEAPRRTFVYLPERALRGERCGVLYMFVGHNLFFDDTATFGTCWGLKDYLDEHPHTIVVAPECNHEGNRRLVEYCPYNTTWFQGIEGLGKEYLDWMVHTLKPWADARYPTLPDRAHTAVGGSSMGGLMSLYAVTAYNAVFSKAACLSPTVRICLPDLLADIHATKFDPDTRIFLSWGEKEPRSRRDLADYTDYALQLTRALGLRGAAVYPYFQRDGAHCEADWRRQLPECFDYLYEGGAHCGEQT